MNLSFLRPFALTVALSLGALGNANAVEYSTLDTQASRLSFGYSQMGVKMDGAFSDMKATAFSFDPANPAAAQVAIDIPLTAIDAGYAEANTELAKEEWLNPAAHPVASFRSTKVEALGDNRYQITGDLSIKGHTQAVTAPVTYKPEGDAGVFEGTFTFARADYGVGEGQWKDFGIVANDIQIKFHMVAKP